MVEGKLDNSYKKHKEMDRRQFDELEMKMPENGTGVIEKCKWWKGMRGMTQWAMQSMVSGIKEWAMKARVNGNLGNDEDCR